MRVHPLSLIAAAGGAVSLAACAPAIHSQRDEAIPIPHGASWAWAKTDSGGRTERQERGAEARPEGGAATARSGYDPSAERAIPSQRFHRALESALVAKGFQRVEDRSQADFLLSLDIEGPPGGARARAMTGIGVGWGGGFGPWGWGRPYRFYATWGPWSPWLWSPWGFGWYGVPYYGVAAYPAWQVPARSLVIVAVLRERSSGEVAWRAQYRADAYDLAYLTQRHAQDIADKLVASLR